MPVTGIELTDNVLLRLDTGTQTGKPAKPIGLTFISFERMMAARNNAPIIVSLANLRQLPEELWQAVLHVITMPSVSDFLSMNLSLFPKSPPLPKLLAA